ncbi:MAG: hypothetical protein ACE5E1_05560, partial [Phycisphaerae bacterium]
MRFFDRPAPRRQPLILTIGLLLLGVRCHSPQAGPAGDQVERYEDRMTATMPVVAAPDLPAMDQPAPVELSGEVAATEPSLDTAIWLHLPDPSTAPEIFKKRLEITRFGQENIEREYREIYQETEKLIKEIERPRQVRLTLADCLRRALANNYQIKIDGYAPAISTAQVVQAEAAFDVAFFANVNRNNTDRPTPSQLLASATDTTIVNGGIRKLLATGANVTLSHVMTRIDNPGFQFQTLNPSWTQNFQAELR